MVRGEGGTREADPDRAEFVATVARIAGQACSVLEQYPMRGSGAYPLGVVHRELGAQHELLRQAIETFPGPLALNADGRPDKLGYDLAGLMGFLQHVSVYYHGLADLPSQLRAQANRDLATTHLHARHVRDRSRR